MSGWDQHDCMASCHWLQQAKQSCVKIIRQSSIKYLQRLNSNSQIVFSLVDIDREIIRPSSRKLGSPYQRLAHASLARAIRLANPGKPAGRPCEFNTGGILLRVNQAAANDEIVFRYFKKEFRQ